MGSILKDAGVIIDVHTCMHIQDIELIELYYQLLSGLKRSKKIQEHGNPIQVTGMNTQEQIFGLKINHTWNVN